MDFSLLDNHELRICREQMLSYQKSLIRLKKENERLMEKENGEAVEFGWWLREQFRCNLLMVNEMTKEMRARGLER